MRTEVIYCMETLNLSIYDVPLVEDVDMSKYQENGYSKLQIVLVDHNKIFDMSLEANHLVEIIDHHQRYKESFGHVKLTLEMVGSCATLVMKRIWEQDSNFQVLGHNPILGELNNISSPKLNACRLRIVPLYFCRMRIL